MKGKGWSSNVSLYMLRASYWRSRWMKRFKRGNRWDFNVSHSCFFFFLKRTELQNHTKAKTIMRHEWVSVCVCVCMYVAYHLSAPVDCLSPSRSPLWSEHTPVWYWPPPACGNVSDFQSASQTESRHHGTHWRHLLDAIITTSQAQQVWLGFTTKHWSGSHRAQCWGSWRSNNSIPGRWGRWPLSQPCAAAH